MATIKIQYTLQWNCLGYPGCAFIYELPNSAAVNRTHMCCLRWRRISPQLWNAGSRVCWLHFGSDAAGCSWKAKTPPMKIRNGVLYIPADPQLWMQHARLWEQKSADRLKASNAAMCDKILELRFWVQISCWAAVMIGLITAFGNWSCRISTAMRDGCAFIYELPNSAVVNRTHMC